MNKEHYEALVSSPGWPAFQKFLCDRRMDIMEALAGDHIVEADRGKAIKECVIYKELAELRWEQICKFYGIETKETEQ